MKQLLLLIIGLLAAGGSFAQTIPDYDSLVVVTHYDPSRTPSKEYVQSSIVETGRAALSKREAAKFNRKLYKKSSYGASQAMTPNDEMVIIYYLDGIAAQQVKISLWTGNLFASMPLEVQRQGDCLCEGDGGYCCSEGGISKGFKLFLIRLLEKHSLEVDREGIMNIGK